MSEAHHLLGSRYNLYWLLAHLSFSQRSFDAFDRRRRRIAERLVAEIEAAAPHTIESIARVDLEPSSQRRRATGSNADIDFSRPILFPGAAKHMPAIGKWTPQFFSENYGDAIVPYVGHFKADGADLEYATMRGVVDKLDGGTLKYAKFCGLMHEYPELGRDFDMELNKSILPEHSFLSSMQIFLGGRGTETLTHCEVSLNLFVQIVGKKRWLLFPPSLTPVLNPIIDRAPYFRSSHMFEEPDPAIDQRFGRYLGYEVVLEPGDILYNPPFYWHYVSNLTTSIGVSFKYQNPWMSLRTAPWMFLMSMLATKPNVVRGFLDARRGKILPPLRRF